MMAFVRWQITVVLSEDVFLPFDGVCWLVDDHLLLSEDILLLSDDMLCCLMTLMLPPMFSLLILYFHSEYIFFKFLPSDFSP